MDLLRSEVEGTFSRLRATKVNFDVDFIRAQTVHQTGWATDANLSSRNILRVDLEVIGHVVKLNGDGDGHLSHWIASNGQPQSDREEQRKELQAKIMEHVFVQEVH
jgi:hypothetical protein